MAPPQIYLFFNGFKLDTITIVFQYNAMNEQYIIIESIITKEYTVEPIKAYVYNDFFYLLPTGSKTIQNTIATSIHVHNGLILP